MISFLSINAYLLNLIKVTEKYMRFHKLAIFLTKIISIVLVTSAIISEVCRMYILINNYNLSDNFQLLFWVSRFALAIHLIESLIMSYYINLKNENYIKYGIYTFLVGIVSFVELKNSEDKG